MPGLLKEFNEFNKTEAQMFNSIYQMTFKLIKNHIFGVNMSRFLPSFFTQPYNGHYYVMLRNLSVKH